MVLRPTVDDMAYIANEFQKPFYEDELQWLILTKTKDGSRAKVTPYIDARSIQERLDKIVGPFNWSQRFLRGPQGGMMCLLSIRVFNEDGSYDWVTKSNGGENTDFEAVKGGYTVAFRRAAVEWGFGRYLYLTRFQEWVELNSYGQIEQPPRVPSELLPQD